MSDTFTQITESEPLLVRYNPLLGWIFLPLGALLTTLCLVLLALGRFTVGVIIGPLTMFIGYGYLTKHYLSIAPNRVCLHNLLGNTVKRYPFVSLSDIELEGSKLYIRDPNQSDKKSKVSIPQWMIRTEDIEALQRFLSQ